MSTYKKQLLKLYVRLLLYYKIRDENENKRHNKQILPIIENPTILDYLTKYELQEKIKFNKSLHDGDKDMLDGQYSLDETYYNIIDEKYKSTPKLGSIAVPNSGADSTNGSDSDEHDDDDDDNDDAVTKVYKYIVENFLKNKLKDPTLKEITSKLTTIFEYDKLIKLFQKHRCKLTPRTETETETKIQELERGYGCNEIDAIIILLDNIKMETFGRATAVSLEQGKASSPILARAPIQQVSQGQGQISAERATRAAQAQRIRAAQAQRIQPIQMQESSSPTESLAASAQATQAPATMVTAPAQGPVTRSQASASTSASASAPASASTASSASTSASTSASASELPQRRVETSNLLSEAPTALAKLRVLLGNDLIDMLNKNTDESIKKLRETYSTETVIESLNNVILFLNNEPFDKKTKGISDTIFDKAYKTALEPFLKKILPYTKGNTLGNAAVLVQRKAIIITLGKVKITEKIKNNIKKLYDYQGALAYLKEDLESIISELR